jgi:hypothetical protein
VIELADDTRLHDACEHVEVNDHAACRAFVLERAVEGDIETIRVPVQPRTLAVMVREHVRRLELERFADLHDKRSSASPRTPPSMLKTNRSRLVAMHVQGEVAPAYIPGSIYEVTADGRALVLPTVGGITLNVRVGDSAFGFVGDHIEPAVSSAHPNDKINVGYCVLACVGNEATILSGEAKGERGVVTGKHGGVEHVMIDFPTSVMEKMQLGDRIGIRAMGVGLEIEDAGDVRVFNCAPDFLDAWGVHWNNGRLHVPVAKRVPAAVMGSGLGRQTVARGDYDIQTFDEATVAEYGLHELRFGDIVAIDDADHSYGRIYRKGAVSIGIVAHGASELAGHGPGVTSLLTSRTGALVPSVDPDANIATILKLR